MVSYMMKYVFYQGCCNGIKPKGGWVYRAHQFRSSQEILPFEKREKEKKKKIKVRWLQNLKRLVRQKLGHSRYPENPKKAGIKN